MDTLERLLAAIPVDLSVDRLWLVGDLVNRGPRSLDVLRWVRAHDAAVTCVLGNHDLHLLARAAGAPAKRLDTLDDLLAAPDRDDLVDWLRRQPLLHVEAPWVMVHAGLHPAWTIEEAQQLAAEVEAELRGPRWRELVLAPRGHEAWSPALRGLPRWRAILSYLVRVRTCHADGRIEPSHSGPPEEALPGCVPWFELGGARWRTHVPVFGHYSALGLHLDEDHAALDTGCVWGGALTALRLEDRRVYQVPAIERRR